MIETKISNNVRWKRWPAALLPILLLALILLFGSRVLSVQAETAAPDTICTVNAAGTGSHATIQEAADDPLCAEVGIDAGVYYENITITHNIAIQGAGPGQTIVYGNTLGKSVFKLIDETGAPGPDLIVSLSDMTIQGGSGVYGGGINNGRWCRLTGNNLELEGNHVSSGGGAIYNAGVLTITNSSINGNIARSGGGIYSNDSISGSPALFMSNCEIVGNYATGSGGGIWVNSQAEISNSLIFDNRSDLNAGGIFASTTAYSGRMITITESIIRENISGYTAGIVVQNHVQIEASQIISNTGGKTLTEYVWIYGGGIAVLSERGALTLTNTTVSHNVLESIPENRGCGGGIYVDHQGAQLLMVNTTVSHSDPGGVADSKCGFNAADSTAAITIRSSDISHNLGQGITGQGTLTVNDSQIYENAGIGIAYHCYNCGTSPGIVTLKNSLVTQNGGNGINGNDVTITHSTIRDHPGYGVYGDHLYMVFSTVNANNNSYEGLPGGGVRGEDVEIRSSAIYDNYSAQDGGGINATSALTVVNSTVSGNTANGNGGGIAFSGSGAAFLDSVTVAYNTADLDADAIGSGGGIYRDATAGAFYSQNSIIAGNDDLSVLTPLKDQDCYGDFTTGTSNIIGVYAGTNCSGFSSVWDHRDVDPLLRVLRDNGGPTHTHALYPASPAIDPTASPGLVCQDYDQRGADRDATCDIGAYEVATCAAPVTPTLTIIADGNHIQLDWDRYQVNREVEIRRGTDPHVFGSFATIATNLTANTNYTDYDAIGDYTTNNFYMVRGQNACGDNSGWSNRVGEYDFRLNADQAAQIFAANGVLRYLHFAVISIPIEGADLPTTADEVAAYIDPDGGVRGVAKWNPQTHSWIVRRVGSPYGTGDFPVAPGDVLFLGMVESAPDTFAWVGDLPAVGSIQNNLVSDAPNTLIVPLDQTGAFDMTADGLAAEIGGVTHVGVWSTAQQHWYLRIVGQAGPNFTIYPGQPYGIRTGPTTPVVWP